METSRKMLDLLELIPDHTMSIEQKAFKPAGKGIFNGKFLPMYKFRREPSHVEDFDWETDDCGWPWPITWRIAIWRDNGTLISICSNHRAQFEGRHVVFTIHRVGKCKLEGAIYGKTDAAIAETATFFWSIKDSLESNAGLEISAHKEEEDVVAHDKRYHFDFAALRADQLAHIMDANPARHFDFRTGSWNVEQSLILATRSYPLNLSLIHSEGKGGLLLKDGGTVFVDALEQRQSSFGSLRIAAEMEFDDIDGRFADADMMPVNRTNLERILKLAQKFEKLGFGPLDEESVLLPFAANVKALDYQMDVQDMEPEMFHSLDIVTKDLTLKIFHDENDVDVLIAALNRIAELGHFERLSVSVDYYVKVDSGELYDYETVQPLAEALIAVINGNPNLSYLDISDSYWLLDWGPHLKNVLKAMEDHKGIRIFKVQHYRWDVDLRDDVTVPRKPHVTWLEQLLSRNRNVTVIERSDKRCLDLNDRISKLYLINHWYNGSAKLAKDSTAVRFVLVAAALVERALENFQLTSLLLSNQTEILCEFIQGLDLEERGT